MSCGHRLGDDQPLADGQLSRIRASSRISPPSANFACVQRARREHQAVGDRHPFGVPRPGRQLEVVDHGVEHQAGVLVHLFEAASINSDEIGFASAAWWRRRRPVSTMPR